MGLFIASWGCFKASKEVAIWGEEARERISGTFNMSAQTTKCTFVIEKNVAIVGHSELKIAL
jgi:hypothetical protein